MSYKNTPDRSMSVRGVTFAYRRLGPDGGVPLILLNHLSAVLDNWEPHVVVGLAARRPVITFDHRGVAASGGSTPWRNGATHAFLDRLKKRTNDRDKAISLSSFRAQPKAIHHWGRQAPADLSRIHQPVLVANGESDRMVPSVNTIAPEFLER
ncbi:alpha/beta fold hydrolase [Streptomyces sp. NPDC085596]|uniref:alpha/beta fold hydrolase n=1 Tax=Streptomyces sp. NPDC085596 TaxID=3365731 RepID=UPI0037D4C5DE